MNGAEFGLRMSTIPQRHNSITLPAVTNMNDCDSVYKLSVTRFLN